jgi:hypothetical protein
MKVLQVLALSATLMIVKFPFLSVSFPIEGVFDLPW